MSPLHNMVGSERCTWVTMPTFRELTLEETALDLASVCLGKDKMYGYCPNRPKERDTLYSPDKSQDPSQGW